MLSFSHNPVTILKSSWTHNYLIRTLLQREILGRYQGSVLGIFWSFLNPVIMLAIYTFVFSVVFKARWHSGGDSKTEFALLLFAGLLVFNLFSECITRAPTLISGNVNYVKKVVFPLEVISLVSVLAALFHFLIGMSVWVVAYVLLYGFPSLCIISIPLILIPLLLLVMGVSWILSSIGVFLKDISQVVSVVVTVLMFLSPIFYPASALPEAYQSLLLLNPLTPIIEMMRGAMFFGQWPDLSLLTISTLVGCSFSYAGFYLFQTLRKGFADVL